MSTSSQVQTPKRHAVALAGQPGEPGKQIGRKVSFGLGLSGRMLGGLALTGLAFALATPGPLHAADVPTSQEKAANVARMKAESLNGGLTRYSSAKCMHELGGGSCMVKANADGYRFEFLGGTPGWQTLKKKATVETTILVSPDGSKVKQVIYNGVPK